MMTTGEVIGVLRAIERKVWEHDISSPGDCPEYQEHHEACTDIIKYIRDYIDLIHKYDGIPSISGMYTDMRVTMYRDSDPVPTDPDEYLKREV